MSLLPAMERSASGVKSPGEGEHWSDHDSAFNHLNDLPLAERVFFDDIGIDTEGGIDEIGSKERDESIVPLWYNSRYVSTLILMLFVIYNVRFLIINDLKMCREGRDGAADLDPHVMNGYLLTNDMFSYVNSTGILPEIITRRVKSPVYVIALIELCMLMYLLGHLLLNILIVFTNNFDPNNEDRTNHARWKAVSNIYWYDLQKLSIFSAIKMLGRLVPQRLSYDINYALWYDPKPAWRTLTWILVTRPLCLLIGLDCFLVKYRQTASHILLDEEKFGLDHLMAGIIFLNQVLAVTDIYGTIKDRLYRFVFAGEDGIMTDKELIRQDVWESVVTMTVFDNYPWYKAHCMMCSWCDDDFQMLTLDTKEKPQKRQPTNRVLSDSNEMTNERS